MKKETLICRLVPGCIVLNVTNGDGNDNGDHFIGFQDSYFEDEYSFHDT